MMDREKSCADRIGDELESRLAYFDDIGQRMASDDYDISDGARDELYELPLEVSTLVTYKVLLSTGGPADWFMVTVNPKGDPSSITYHHADWFDHASVDLTGEDFDRAWAALEPFCEDYS